MTNDAPRARLVNLTPHDLVVFAGDREILRIPTSQDVLRLEELQTAVSPTLIQGHLVEIVTIEYGAPDTSLPASEPAVFYVVSRIAANALRARRDVLFPLDDVRDERGAIIGCRRFAQLRS